MPIVQNAQEAMGFLISQRTHIEPRVFEIQYPRIQYPLLTPVSTEAGETAKTITFFSSDRVGEAKWVHHRSRDIPLVETYHAQHEREVHEGGVGYDYSLYELQVAANLGMPLNADKAQAARRAYEQFIDRLALNGDAAIGWKGLFNDDNVTAAAATNGAAGTATWATKTPEEIMEDVNSALNMIQEETLQVELANTVILPVKQYNLIATTWRRDRTILRHLMDGNVYTAETGAPLMIRSARGLETAGASNSARMVVYDRNIDVLKLHISMPLRFSEPYQDGPRTFVVPGTYRTGGLEIRRPGAVRYVDGI